jgi:hypothetical protein
MRAVSAERNGVYSLKFSIDSQEYGGIYGVEEMEKIFKDISNEVLDELSEKISKGVIDVDEANLFHQDIVWQRFSKRFRLDYKFIPY